jgi:hypothetical protein
MLACAVALVLLMDVSGSITDRDMRLQLDATARALVSEEVTNIIQRLHGGLAVKAIAFGPWPESNTPWVIIQTPQNKHLTLHLGLGNINEMMQFRMVLI